MIYRFSGLIVKVTRIGQMSDNIGQFKCDVKGRIVGAKRNATLATYKISSKTPAQAGREAYVKFRQGYEIAETI